MSAAAPALHRIGGTALVLAALAVPLVFGVLPLIILIGGALGIGIAPADEGFTFDHLLGALGSATVQEALKNSVLIAIGSVIGAGIVSVPIVLRQAELERGGRHRVLAAGLDALMTLPIALPGIVIGFFAIVLVGRTGLIALAWDQVSGLAYTFLGMLIAYVYFSLPRVLGPLRGAAGDLDPSLIETARTLGASRPRAFLTVTVPLLLPAIVETAGTATAVALGGYGTVATLSEGIRMLPLNVVNALSTGYRLAESSALAVILAAAATAALVAGRLLARLVAWAVSR